MRIKLKMDTFILMTQTCIRFIREIAMLELVEMMKIMFVYTSRY